MHHLILVIDIHMDNIISVLCLRGSERLVSSAWVTRLLSGRAMIQIKFMGLQSLYS